MLNHLLLNENSNPGVLLALPETSLSPNSRLTPPRWLGFLAISFGTFCTAIGGTTNVAGVTALRFFLGAFEAGLFPGVIYYFSFWYRREERAIRIAAFMCSATLSGAFGGCIAYGVGHMNGAAGLEGWRWLFIIEGLPSSELPALVS